MAAEAVMGFLAKEKKDEGEEELQLRSDDIVHVPASEVDRTLAERGKRYGTFKDNSVVYVNLLEVFESSPNWDSAPPEVRHALGNIATKLARLLTGDVMYFDNWRDIAGYATLMDKICQGEVR